MNDDGTGIWRFETDRLSVGPWHQAADHLGVDLGRTVAEMLTVRVTAALPEAWRGDGAVSSPTTWIEDRDAEASILLLVERALLQPVGILILAEGPDPEQPTELRLGYLLAESAWGRGLATEFVAGLIDWAREESAVRSIEAGTDPENRASVRVLEKCGFHLTDDSDNDTSHYRLDLARRNEWDDYAADWDGDLAARAYAAAAFESLPSVLGDAGVALDGARVIDFGCGTGLLTELLVAAGASVHAIDTSTAMLDVLDAKVEEHRWPGVRSSTSLPDTDESFDLVVCSSVCSFLDDYPATVAELTERLGGDGFFVQWDWERADGDDHGLSRSEIREALTDAGLVEVTVAEAFRVDVDDQTMAPLIGHGRRRRATA